MTRPTSIIMGRDRDVIPVLMSIHATSDKPVILDVTHNTGKMWKGLDYPVIRLDQAAGLPVDTRGDFGRLPFRSQIFDVLVFDPPHLPNHAASKNSSLIFKKNYGITESDQYGR